MLGCDSIIRYNHAGTCKLLKLHECQIYILFEDMYEILKKVHGDDEISEFCGEFVTKEDIEFLR